MVSRLFLLCIILLTQYKRYLSYVFPSPARHVLRNKHVINMSSRNETLRAPRRSQSFLSPTFADVNETGNEKNKALRGWIEQPGSSNNIIPTGPDSLARIEQQVNDNVNMRVLNSANNKEAAKYFKMVESLAPNEMLTKFATTAPRPVQEAAKSTIMNLLGNLPNYALDAALITTNTKLANLLYQMQMTGYMFKNAEYRMSLTRMLKGLPRLPPPSQLITDNFTLTLPLDAGTTLLGTATVHTATGSANISVHELTTALSKEVLALRSELMQVRSVRENELRSNLLTYIQALPEPELVQLTANMSEEVLLAIQMLVDALMERMGIPYGSNDNTSITGGVSASVRGGANGNINGGNKDTTNGPQQEVVVQQSVGQLAQLCMWQMVVGYKLRELEVLETGAAQLD